MIVGTPEDDFFEENSEIQYISEVARLIRTFTKVVAGKIMWGIWMAFDPRSSLFQMNLDEKLFHIKNEYLKDPNFEWDNPVVLEVIEAYPRFGLTMMGKMYHNAMHMYHLAYSEGLQLKPKDKLGFIKASKGYHEELEKFKNDYEKSLEAEGAKAAGEVQSGYLSRRKRGR